MSEDGRWSPFFFLAPSCTLGSELPLTILQALCYSVLIKEGGGGSKLSRLMLLPGAGWQWRGHQHLLRSQWHLHSLSLCNNVSHAALSFTIYLHQSYVQSKAMHKGKKALLCFVFLFSLCIKSYLKLQRTLGPVSQDKDGKKRNLSK